MTTPINSRDLLLQQTTPRVLNIASNYISLVSPNLEARYTADNNPTPAILEVTAILSGTLKGQVVFELTGLLPNTSLVLDSQNSNKLLLDPNTFATDTVTIVAKLSFEGVEYVSVPVTAYRNYTSIVTRLSRAFDNVPADVNGNNYTLPASNYLELYNGITKLTTNVTYGPPIQTKSGLTCIVNSTSGEISVTQAQPNSWLSDYETFTLTATRNFIPYTVTYTISKVREGGTGIDSTPPPTPGNFIATAAINTILIEHDNPNYTQGSGHNNTVLYGKVYSTGDTLTPFNPEEVIAEFTGNVYTLPSEPGTTWRLWAKWKSIDGFLSTIPAGGTNGLTVTTGQDVTKLLEILTGELTESQLYSDLTSRIDLIDDPVTGLVVKTDGLINTYGTTVSAAASAATAVQAKADAIIARGLAEGAANTASTQASLATSARDAAGTSATNASQSASAAATSASNAAGSASTAGTQASLATSARDAAGTSATNASQSASAAATSASNAAGSASTATSQATLATSAKDAAGTSATNASVSATNAATSAVNAAGSASSAASTLQQVQASNATALAAVQTLASTVAGPNGATAQYTVKTDVNGNVAGFGLSNTSNIAGGSTSEFIIVADKFAIAAVNTDNTLNDGSPFFHRTSATSINGVTVPAGTYMKSAFIHDATITNAKIADLAVNNAKIASLSADKINAGFISADRIEAGSIAASKLSVTTLSSVTANMGTVTAGKMQSQDGQFVIDLTNKFISISV